MIRVVKALLTHLFFIFVFAFCYYYFSTHFHNNNQYKQNKSNYYSSESKLDSIIDFFLFSTTIQAGVGVTDILPSSIYGKMIMILQQLIMISISVITIYHFTK